MHHPYHIGSGGFFILAMKLLIKTIFLISFLAVGFSAIASNDYASVYKSWNAILASQPDTVISKIHIEIGSPFSIEIKALDKKDKDIKRIVNDEALAVSINDSVWFVNTSYLKKYYTGIALPYMRHYAPLYFNDKIAYLQYSNDVDNAVLYQLASFVNNGMSTASALQFLTSYGFNYENAYLFIIDPKGKTVDAVNDSKMSALLSPYLDLRKRYESMNYYDEPFVINYYFLEYIDRISADDSVPYLSE